MITFEYMSKKIITIRVDEEIYENIATQAKKEDRSISSVLQRLLKKAFGKEK